MSGIYQIIKKLSFLQPLRPAWRALRRWFARRMTPLPQPASIPSPCASWGGDPLDLYLTRKLDAFLASPGANIVFPTAEVPSVSIIILSFNQAALLLECLQSVACHTNLPYEIILADNASRDRTLELLDRVQGARVIRNQENLDFIKGNNQASFHARGKYLLFLNHDTVVTPDWLEAMVRTMETWPACGAVGVRLIRMDGRLQEAGSLLRPDGTAFGYGRDDPNPYKPEYGHAREVDYCSGACLLVERETFLGLGGFDERYLPAYYEETDLCLQLRRLGKKVVYQGQAIVLHREDGVLSGRAQALCQANHPKFLNKFRKDLESLPDFDALHSRDRRTGKRILLLDDFIPDPFRGAGMPRLKLLLLDLAALGYLVTYVPLIDATPKGPTLRELQRLGIEVFHGSFSLANLLEERKGFYDTVIVGKPHNAEQMLWRLRNLFPHACLIYDTEAIVHQREAARAELEGKPMAPEALAAMAEWEFSLMRMADRVLTVSPSDRQLALKGSGNPRVRVYGYPIVARENAPGFHSRNGILFVGGLTEAHAPNVDALQGFLQESWPIIREALPHGVFRIAGANPCSKVVNAASEGVEFLGRVENLEAVFDSSRVVVCPLRYGAGIPIKLAEALAMGVPTVASPKAAEGYGILDGSVAAVAYDWNSFAHEVIHLLTNQHAWNLRQEAALQFARDHLDPVKQRLDLRDFLESPESLEAQAA
ncbi:MAG: glycosyltransferase [Gemmataceae bacterium]|nr:glycosyltransferase [Gemmataceae bacterium]